MARNDSPLIRPGGKICPTHGKAVPCFVCDSINHARVSGGKAQPIRETKPSGALGYIVTGGVPDQKDLAAWIKRVGENDPARMAMILADTERPAGVNRHRYGVAIRSAAGQPMLNAQPREVFTALEGKTRVRRGHRLDKAGVFKRIVVKPTTARTGAAGWGERLWLVYNLKYGKGVVVVTDEGDESKVFPQYSDLRSALVKSGWEIIR